MSNDQRGSGSRQGRSAQRFRRAAGVLALLIMAGSTLVATAVAAPNHAHGRGRGASAVVAPAPAPCDIFAAGNTPCVAAYSATRAMYAAYRGPLYLIQRASDGTSLDVGTLADGDVDAAEQDRFCAGTRCVITELIDQSPDENNLAIEGPGANGGADQGVSAGTLPISIAGRQAYGMSFGPGMGYRDDNTRGMPVGAEAESMYMVTSGTHYNDSCCFDFGNAETTEQDTGNGHMDAIYFGADCWLEPPRCPPGGPWVEADLENGIIASDDGDLQDPTYTGSTSPFVTAVLENNGTNAFLLGAANAQSGPLGLIWSGLLPSNSWDPDPPSTLTPYPANPTVTRVTNPLLSGYAPMRKEGGIVLGTGGDDTGSGVGSFFEGAITAGVPGLKVESALQADIVAAGYGTSGAGPAPDTPRFTVRTPSHEAVAAVTCPASCTAQMTVAVPSLPVLKRARASRPIRVQSSVQKLSGASVMRVRLPAGLIRRARRWGIRRVKATITLRAVASSPGIPAVSRSVTVAIGL